MTLRALICLVLLAGLALPGIAQTRLDIPEARLAAAHLIDAGQPAAALEITTVLLQRDPSDIAGLILHAHASRALGDQPRAQHHARRAWRLSERPVDRYGSAMAMAQSLSSDGRKTMAQLWLRRAVQSAPTEATQARAVRDYLFVRAANPWQIDLRSGVSPTDNVNNAPRDNTIVFGNLVLVDPTAVPLSGARISAGATVRLNYGVSQTRRDFAAVFWDESRAILSSAARREVPSARASDFHYREVGVEMGRDFAPGPESPRSTLSLRATRIDYGGRHLSDELRLRFAQRRDIGEGRGFFWSASLARAERQDKVDRSATIAEGTAQWSVPTRAGGRIDWLAGLERHASDSAAIAHDAVKLGVNWTMAQPLLGAGLSLGVAGEYRSFDRALYGPDPREDMRLSLSASLLFRNLEAYGFAPRLTVTADRTGSNVTLFETERLGLSLALQSVF